MKRKISTIGILMAFLVLGGLFLGCPNGTEQSTNTIRVTVQNNSGYKLYSVRAGGVEIGDIDIGTTQRKDIEPDGLSYSVFFTIRLTSTNVNIRTAESKVYTSDVTVIIENTTMVTLTTGEQSVKALSQLISDIQNNGNNGNDNDDDDNNNGNDNDDNDNNDGLTPGTLPEGTLAQKLNYISLQSVSNVLYDIPIDMDMIFGSISDPACETRGTNVVIHIHSADPNDIKTISVPTVNPGAIFGVRAANVTLRLSNIILKGATNNSNSVIFAEDGGTIIIEDGTVITGNTKTVSTVACAVKAQDGGKIIMNGGEISGNKSTNLNSSTGAVGLGNAFFTMNGGVISENEGALGGGIYFQRQSTVIINGGVIRNNRANTGGGIYGIDSSLTINGGEISGNTGVNAGGVAIYNTGSLAINGGIIKNNSASDSGGGIYALDRTLTQNGGGSRINVSITGGEIIGNSAKYGGGIALYNSRLTKTGGYIAGTDSGINANVSTQNQGDAILYCRDTTFWDRKLSLTQSDNISTDNLSNGWAYLGVEGSF